MTNTHKQQRFANNQDNHDHRNEAFHHGENNQNISEDLESLTMSEVSLINLIF